MEEDPALRVRVGALPKKDRQGEPEQSHRQRLTPCTSLDQFWDAKLVDPHGRRPELYA